MQARNNESAARHPPTPQNNEGVALSAPDLIGLSTSSIMDTPPANESLLIPGRCTLINLQIQSLFFGKQIISCKFNLMIRYSNSYLEPT